MKYLSVVFYFENHAKLGLNSCLFTLKTSCLLDHIWLNQWQINLLLSLARRQMATSFQLDSQNESHVHRLVCLWTLILLENKLHGAPCPSRDSNQRHLFGKWPLHHAGTFLFPCSQLVHGLIAPQVWIWVNVVTCPGLHWIGSSNPITLYRNKRV